MSCGDNDFEKIPILGVKAFRDDAKLPAKSTQLAAGYDVFAWTEEAQSIGDSGKVRSAIIIHPGKRAVIKTGINLRIPENYEVQVRPRSGLAAKFGITVLNTPGTIDADYSGSGEDYEVKVILANFGDNDFVVNHGDKIAQIVFNQLPIHIYHEDENDELINTADRVGGLGSTGNV